MLTVLLTLGTCAVGVITIVVLSLYVCVSVTTKSAAYLIYMSKTRYHRVLYGIFKVFVMWLSLKTLCLKVQASFADCHYLPRFLTSSQWTDGTAMASFEHKECVQFDSTYNTTDLPLIRAR